jgi:probable DNA metabolism protein
MSFFFYDKTFEGLLCAVFDAYSLRVFPEKLLRTGDLPPLFAERLHGVVTEEGHANRVWRALENKTQRCVRNMLFHVWLSELDGSDELLFRYLCKIFASEERMGAYNFGDADCLEVEKIARKVSREAQYIRQFVRFRKAVDEVFFASVRPIYNALPLAVGHFADRFADQQWVMYDLSRRYGYFYDLRAVREVSFADDRLLSGGRLDEALMAEDERVFQDLWRGYFKATAIGERFNPRLQRRNMPVRFWRYLTEMSGDDAGFFERSADPPSA